MVWGGGGVVPCGGSGTNSSLGLEIRGTLHSLSSEIRLELVTAVLNRVSQPAHTTHPPDPTMIVEPVCVCVFACVRLLCAVHGCQEEHYNDMERSDINTLRYTYLFSNILQMC